MEAERVHVLSVLALLLVPLGCTTVPQQTGEGIPALQVDVEPPKGKSLIYIVRKKAWLAFLNVGSLQIDRQEIASLRAGNYVRAVLDPGEHMVTIRDNYSKRASISRFVVEPNRCHFYSTGPTGSGWQLESLALTAAQEMMRSCSLVGESDLSKRVVTRPSRKTPTRPDPPPAPPDVKPARARRERPEPHPLPPPSSP